MGWSLNGDGAVGVALLTNPPENVLSYALLEELDELLQQVADDRSTSVLLVSSDVPGYFVAHADLDDVVRLVDGGRGPGSPDYWGIALERLSQIPQPVIAAVNGQAWGGGCELALACMMRVAAESAHFSFVEVGAGAIPGAGGTQRLPRLVGLSQAAEMILSGRVVGAREAHRMGMVNEVLPDDDFLAVAVEWAARLARQPRHTLAAAKRALIDGRRMPLAEGLAYEQRLFRDVLRSPESRAMFHPDGD